MDKMLPLNAGAEDQRGVCALRPRTTHAPRRAGSGPPTPGLGQSTRARSARWAPGGGPWNWSLGELEARVQCRLRESLGSVRATLRQLDHQGTGRVGLPEFTGFLGSLLGLGPHQITPLVHQVCGRCGVAVDYMRFLQTYSPPGRHGAATGTASWSAERRPMTLTEIQRLLKNKMAGSSLAHVFRVSDPRGEGRVRRQALRRILEECCPPLTDLEFQRLWDHCSPNGTEHISYKDLLHKLKDSSPETLDLGPVCTRMDFSSPGAVTKDRVRLKIGPRARKIRSGDADAQDRQEPSNPPDQTQGLNTTQRQTLFHQEMCLNRVPVWETLQAADVTASGLVQQEVLRNVLCNFLFPMSPRSFHKLTRGYGVKEAGPVKWKYFLGHFLEPAERPKDPPLIADGALHQLLPKESPPDLEEEEDISSRLKEVFHLLDPSGSGRVVRAELRLALEAPYLRLGCTGGPPGRPPHRGPRLRLSRAGVSKLLNRLDPGHTGLVHRAHLDAVLLPDTGPSPPSPSCTEDPAPLLGEGGDRGEGQAQENLEGLLGSGFAALCLSDPGGSEAGSCDDLTKAGPIAHTHPDEETPLDLNEPDPSGLDDIGPEHSGPDHKGPDQSGPDLSRPDCSEQGNTGLDNSGPDLLRASEPDHIGPDLSGPEKSGPDLSGPDGSGLGNTGLDHSGPDHSGPHSPLRPPSSPTGEAGAQGILEIVFRRMRESLERRRVTLAERIQATTHPSPDGTLGERDLRKVLEDCWVVLEEAHFQHVTALLGFRQGRLACSGLLDQYGEFCCRPKKQQGPGHHGDEPDKARLLSAEECLATMRVRMADGRTDAAFGLDTVDRDGAIDAGHLRQVLRSLGVNASDREFQRLLYLIGLQPKARLRRSVHQGWARETSPRALDQIQEQLVSDLCFKWAFMLQTLCSPQEDQRELVFKKSLRNHLFTYDLPLRPAEFEQLWRRFDPEGRGCVMLVDFLDKLGVKHDGKPSVRGSQVAAGEDQRGRVEDTLSNVALAEVLEMKVPMDSARRKLVCQDFLSASRPQEEEVTGSARPDPQPASPSESLHGSVPDRVLSQLRVMAPVLLKVTTLASDALSLWNVQAPDRETDSPPITELLGRIQEMVSRHLFDITKAMVAMESSGTNSISREDLQRVCGRYFRMTPHQFERVWAELPVNASGRLCCGEFLRRFGAADQKSPAEGPACTSLLLPERASSTMSHARRPKTAGVATLRPQSAPQCPPRVWSTMGSRRRSPPGNRKWRRDIHTSPASFRDSSVRCESSSITDTLSTAPPDPVRRFVLGLRPQKVSRTFQRNRLPPPTNTTGPGMLTAQCVEVLLGVHHAIRSSWRPIRQAFVTYDPGRTGQISTRDFRKVLRGFGVSLTEEDFFHLSCYLDAGAVGTVSYNDFLRAYLR